MNNFINKKKKLSVLIPITIKSDTTSLFNLAKIFSSHYKVLLLGVVPIKDDNNLSEGAKNARILRKLLKEQATESIKVKPRIIVSHTPWADIKEIAGNTKHLSFLILGQDKQLKDLGVSANEVMSYPPCDLAIVKGPVPNTVNKIIIPLRGGIHSEKVFRAGLKLSSMTNAMVETFHTKREEDSSSKNNFSGLSHALSTLPKANHYNIETKNYLQTIVDISNKGDIVVAGASKHLATSNDSFGPVADALLDNSKATVILIKGKSLAPSQKESQSFDSRAISVLVDRWFAENTYHSKEFLLISDLIKKKEEQNLKISVALPTLNEEKTIGAVLEICVRELMEKHSLIDEIILMDSNSSDKTREIAKSFNIPVYIHQDVLPSSGARNGKGEALWKSLYVTSGDIVLWTDTDINNYHPRFILGLLGPLLARKAIGLVKGFYRRPLKTKTGGLEKGKGGRVTELSARPLFNLFYPELTGIIQPLAGEYGGRREILENLTFTSGYGVETCILIETVKKFGLPCIAQVDLIERIHNNQPLADLSKMSFAILQTVISSIEKKYNANILEDVNRSIKLIKSYKDEYTLEVQEVAERERPPIVTIKEYREKFNK